MLLTARENIFFFFSLPRLNRIHLEAFECFCIFHANWPIDPPLFLLVAAIDSLMFRSHVQYFQQNAEFLGHEKCSISALRRWEDVEMK